MEEEEEEEEEDAQDLHNHFQKKKHTNEKFPGRQRYTLPEH